MPAAKRLAAMAFAAALCALLGACAGSQRALTLEEFYGFCWPEQIDSGCWDDGLCQDYKDYLAQEHASKEECIKGCNEMQTEKWRVDAMRGCSTTINNATDWCEKYCRLYFDYGPPSQKGQPAP